MHLASRRNVKALVMWLWLGDVSRRFSLTLTFQVSRQAKQRFPKRVRVKDSLTSILPVN